MRLFGYAITAAEQVKIENCGLALAAASHELAEWQECRLEAAEGLVEKPILKALTATLEDGDRLLIWRLCRLAVGMEALVDAMLGYAKRGVTVCSVKDWGQHYWVYGPRDEAIRTLAILADETVASHPPKPKTKARTRWWPPEGHNRRYYGWRREPAHDLRLSPLTPDGKRRPACMRYIRDSREIAVVRRFVKWVDAGVPIDCILAYLDSRGFEQVTGIPWTRKDVLAACSQVRRIEKHGGIY